MPNNLDKMTKMLPVQCRMARAALGLSISDLADKAGVTKGTIDNLEAGKSVKDSTVAKVQGALESAGVEFVPENGGGAGVRFRKRSSKKK